MERLDLINNYINGKLGAEETKSFENALNHDESLRSLLEQETLLKHAVSRYRTMEMKSRMNNISVNSGMSNYLKIAASLMIMGGVLGGGYYYMINTQPVNTNFGNTLKSNQVNEIKPELITENAQKEIALEHKGKNENLISESTPERKINAKKQSSNAQVTVSSPSIQEIDVASPSDFNDNETKSIENDNTGSIKLPKTDVTLEINNSEVLKYKNFNSKLFLIGKFTKKYEIIAVKSDELYLSYNGSFYYLRNNVETSTKLEKVVNTELLKTLNNQLRNHSN